MSTPTTQISRAYLDVPAGQLHYAQTTPRLPGAPLVLLLHQVPRSWDEFRDVLPLLGQAGLHAVAIDLPGYGASDPGPADSIESYADGVTSALDSFDHEHVAVVGHHTGGVVAIEVAARRPERIEWLVLSSTSLIDEAARQRPAHGVDDVKVAADGKYLLDLWHGRQRFYPIDRPDLLHRFVCDALRAGPLRARAGHAAVRAYHMEKRLPLVRARPLLIAAGQDPFAARGADRLLHTMPGAELTTIDEGGIPLPDQLPEAFASAVVNHVQR